MRLRRGHAYSLDKAEYTRGDMLQMPPVFYRQAEVCRFRGPRRKVLEEIQEKIICPHHFQIFVDNDFKVRGYQTVDFSLKNLEEYQKKPRNKSYMTINNKDITKDKTKLQEIYDEFWEFIDDDNNDFKTYILNDKRRK